MVSTRTKTAAVAEARRLGAKMIAEGITDSTWAADFPTPEAGAALVQWLNDHGVPNRGYRPGNPAALSMILRVDNVVFG